MADFDPTQFGAVAADEPPPFDPTQHGAIPVQPPEEPSILQKTGRAVVDTLKGFLPQSVSDVALAPINMIPGFGQAVRPLENIAFGRPISEGVSPLQGIPVVQRIPQIIQAEKTPALSQERFTTGAGVVADLAMLAGFKSALHPELAEVAGIAKPEVAPETVTPTPTEPVATDTEAATPIVPEAAQPVVAPEVASSVPAAESVATAPLSPEVLGKQEPVAPDLPMGTGEAPKITAAAIQDSETGKTFTGPSHPQIYDKFPQIEGDPGEAFTGEGWNTGGNYVDGFVDQHGKFYDREEAAALHGLTNEASMTELEAVAGKISDKAPYKIIKPSPVSEAPVSTTAPLSTETERSISGNKTPVAQTGAVGTGGVSAEFRPEGVQANLPNPVEARPLRVETSQSVAQPLKFDSDNRGIISTVLEAGDQKQNRLRFTFEPVPSEEGAYKIDFANIGKTRDPETAFRIFREHLPNAVSQFSSQFNPKTIYALAANDARFRLYGRLLKQAGVNAEPIQVLSKKGYKITIGNDTTQTQPNAVPTVPSGTLRAAVQFPNGEIQAIKEGERTHAQIYERLYEEGHPNLTSITDPDVASGWQDSQGNFFTSDQVATVLKRKPDTFKGGQITLPKTPSVSVEGQPPTAPLSTETPDRIRSVAMQLPNGEVREGLTHGDLIDNLSKDERDNPKTIAGFTTTSGRFVNREEAFRIAKSYLPDLQKYRGEEKLHFNTIEPLTDDDFSKPITEGGIENATQKGQQQESSITEHPGVPQGSDLPAHGEEVRKGQGERAGGSGSNEPAQEESVDQKAGRIWDEMTPDERFNHIADMNPFNAALNRKQVVASSKLGWNEIQGGNKDILANTLLYPSSENARAAEARLSTSVPEGGTPATAVIKPETLPAAQEQVAPPGITQEAQALVDSGGVPGFVSKNLERIATENGITDIGKKTPNQIIDELRAKSAPEQPAETGISNKRLAEAYGDSAPVAETGKGAGAWKDEGLSRLDNFQKTGDVKDDPYAVLTNLREGKPTGNPLASDVSLLRTEHQRLLEDARNAEGTPGYVDKSKAALDMAKAIKGVAHGPASDVFRALQEYDAPRYDNVTDFDQALRERENRESTPTEKEQFKKVANDVETTRDAAAKEIDGAQAKLNKFPRMKFDEAMANIHDQITELTKNCVL